MNMANSKHIDKIYYYIPRIKTYCLAKYTQSFLQRPLYHFYPHSFGHANTKYCGLNKVLLLLLLNKVPQELQALLFSSDKVFISSIILMWISQKCLSSLSFWQIFKYKTNWHCLIVLSFWRKSQLFMLNHPLQPRLIT